MQPSCLPAVLLGGPPSAMPDQAVANAIRLLTAVNEKLGPLTRHHARAID
jgi:hypothetical protein